MENGELDGYLAMKRRVYLTILPIVIAYNTWYWLYSPVRDTFIRMILPGALLGFLVLWILVYRNVAIRVNEFVGLGIFTVYHVVRFYTAVHTVGNTLFDLYLPWSILYSVFVFMIFEKKKGLVYALSVYVVMLSIGIPLYRQTSTLNYALTQFFVSNIIFIIALYYFQRLFSAYGEVMTWRKMAWQDYLTNIANRRMLDSWIEQEIDKSKEDNTSFSVVYFDIDHFKDLNDHYGHHVGDDVLREFVNVVQRTIGQHEYFGRWGGEEFIVLLPAETTYEAEQVAERIRESIEKHAFQQVGHLTASFGIASFQESDLPNTLLSRADHALYSAKNSGRNAVKVAGL